MTISHEAMILAHDFSIETVLQTISGGTEDRHLHINEPIVICDNSFIGARASILPWTTIVKTILSALVLW